MVEVPKLRGSCKGYGLTDLLVTLVVVAAVAVVGIPSTIGAIRTYQRNGAARQVLAQIRHAQQLAVTRGSVFGFHWAAEPNVNGSADTYRVVRDTTGSCGFPANSLPEDGTNVVVGWQGLSDDFSGMTIQSITDNGSNSLAGVMFDSKGASVNTCTSVSFPVEVVVSDASGRTRVIEIRQAGATRLL